jgi:hypothetical protein
MAQKTVDAEGDDQGIPNDVVDKAAHEAHPTHNKREEILLELYLPVETVLSQENAFKVKEGREEELKALINKSGDLNNPNNRNPEIYRKALIWARQIQLAEQNAAKEILPAEAIKIAGKTFNDVFEDNDIPRIKVQITGFLKAFWDHDTSAVEGFLDKKSEQLKSETALEAILRRRNNSKNSDGIAYKGTQY